MLTSGEGLLKFRSWMSASPQKPNNCSSPIPRPTFPAEWMASPPLVRANAAVRFIPCGQQWRAGGGGGKRGMGTRHESLNAFGPKGQTPTGEPMEGGFEGPKGTYWLPFSRRL